MFDAARQFLIIMRALTCESIPVAVTGVLLGSNSSAIAGWSFRRASGEEMTAFGRDQVTCRSREGPLKSCGRRQWQDTWNPGALPPKNAD